LEEINAELEKIKLLMEKRELKLIMDNSFNMIANIDLDGVILYCNEAYNEVLGLTKERLMKSSFYSLLHPDERGNIKEQIFSQLILNGKGQIESSLVTSEGFYRLVEHRFRLLPGNPKGKDSIVISSQDITEKKRSEMVLKVQRNLAHSVVVSNSFTDFYNTIVTELNTIMEVNNIFVAFYDEENGLLRVGGMSDEKERIEEFPAEGSMTGHLIKGGKSAIYYYDDILKLHSEGKLRLFGTISQVWLGSPIKSGNKIVGAIVIQNYDSKNAFSNLDLDIVEIVANEIANFMEIKSAEEASQKLNIAVIQLSCFCYYYRCTRQN